MTDYRTLLKKYIVLVVSEEGTDFLDLADDVWAIARGNSFSSNDLEELRRVSKEAFEESQKESA